MMPSKTKLILAMTTLTLVAACAEQEKLNEMHDATVKMEKTTGEMNQTTGKMNEVTTKMDDKMAQMATTTERVATTTESVDKKTADVSSKLDNLGDMTNELYDALRQGNALQLRREALSSLLKASSMQMKLSESAKYFMSFEIQLWNLYGQDKDIEKRDILAQQATQEFFMEAAEFAPSGYDVDATATPAPEDIHSVSNRTASFNALAAAMHQLNRKQVSTLNKDSKLEKISMYSLMADALLAKKEIQANSGEVLAQEKLALQLLQTRYNIFPMIFVDLTTKISEKGLIGQAMMATLSWDLDLDRLNKTQLEYFRTEVLQQALDAHKLMTSIGVKPKMGIKVSMILSKMRIKTSGKKDAHIAAAQTALVEKIQELQATIEGTEFDTAVQEGVFEYLNQIKFKLTDHRDNVNYIISNKSQFLSPNMNDLYGRLDYISKKLNEINTLTKTCLNNFDKCLYPENFNYIEYNLPERLEKAFADNQCKVRTNIACGAIYKSAQGPECGVGSYKLAAHPKCGVKNFNIGRSSACEVATYNTGSGPACGFARYNQRKSGEVCGWDVGGECTRSLPMMPRKGGSCFSVPRTCRHPSFGVEAYNSCSDSSFGVQQFKECRAAAHGVETYNSCRDPEFGIEEYATCEHPTHSVVAIKQCKLLEFFDQESGVVKYKECKD